MLDSQCRSYLPEIPIKRDFFKKVFLLWYCDKACATVLNEDPLINKNSAATFRICILSTVIWQVNPIMAVGCFSCYYKIKILTYYCFRNPGEKLTKLQLLLFSRFLQFSHAKYLVKMTTYSILKTKQHKLHLTDTVAVKV